MKRARWTILFAPVCVIAFAACDEPPPEKVRPLGSRVELAAGDVWIGAGDARQRLITGAMLSEEADITAGPGARALMRMGNGAGVFLRGGTELAIRGGAVELRKGEVWADIPADEREMGRFSAGGVTITAAGAGLDVAMKGDAVEVYVARGLAVVTAPGGRNEVESGERAIVSGKGAPRVEPVAFWDDWTGGMADRELLAGLGAKAGGRVYGIDRAVPGSPPGELQIQSQEVRVVVRDGIAHTTVDQRFFNPSSTPLEGWYWFAVPEGASVERFAMEVNGQMVEGEMIERKQAAAAYEEAVQRAFDPALLEWVDGRAFRARVYPIPPTGERRIVLSYMELLPLADGVYRYVYPMGGAGARIQEFSLLVDLGDEGKDLDVSTVEDATIDAKKHTVSMRRSGFTPRSDFLLELRRKEEGEPLRAMRFSSGKAEADYVMLRYSPEVDWAAVKQVPGDVVVVVDTSAGGDDAERQIRMDAVDAILRALSDGDRFAVVAADLFARVVYPAKDLAPATDANVSTAMEKLAEMSSAGATDLGEMFGVALDLVHDGEQPAVVYVGDGRATVGETTPDLLAERLRRSLGDSRARLFTIAVGADADRALLERLARVGGGRMYRIDTAEQAVQEALRFAGQVKAPTVTDLVINAGAGLDQVFSTAAGKVSQGEEVVLYARTHHTLPGKIEITGRLAGAPFKKTYDPDVEEGAKQGYIPTLWARQSLARLMGEGLAQNRGQIIALGLTYGLMTPLTSFLVLESNEAYQQQGIERRPRPALWSGRDADDDRVASAVSGLVVPALLMGCSEMKAEQAQAEDNLAVRQPSGGAAPPSPPSSEPALAKSEAVAPAPAVDMPQRARAEEGHGSGEAPQAGAITSALNVLGGLGTKGGGADRDALAKDEAEKPADVAQIATNAPGTDEKPFFKTGVCSDASQRPLAERRILWQSRLDRAATADEAVRVFFEAGARCELPHWQDRRIMLDLIESRVRAEAEVRALISAFSRYTGIAEYLRRRIMRRTLDPDATMGLFFPSMANWAAARLGLAAMKTPLDRVAEIRRMLAANPNDPVGRAMLVFALADADMIEDALAEAARLRRDGLAGPSILQILCDLEAETGLVADAERTCSEIVEFDPDDADARRQVGDLFLRHGWYDAAYREYRTLVAMLSDPISLLRLAAAAAGMGKVDEALRIERQVASGEGEPGPEDPRRFARLHSAVRLARMILAAKSDPEQVKTLERSLKRTQAVSAPTSLAILVWEDIGAPLDIVASQGQAPYAVAERAASPATGLVMLDLGKSPPPNLAFTVRLSGPLLRRPVPFTVYTINWNGKAFSIGEKQGRVDPRASAATVAGM
ncbi:MAG: VIT domain-containing protein [Deltaproteobacteria bacterium]|nr:VIT domain-containing protein [Deltaproteobacteria bacterium]